MLGISIAVYVYAVLYGLSLIIVADIGVYLRILTVERANTGAFLERRSSGGVGDLMFSMMLLLMLLILTMTALWYGAQVGCVVLGSAWCGEYCLGTLAIGGLGVFIGAVTADHQEIAAIGSTRALWRLYAAGVRTRIVWRGRRGMSLIYLALWSVVGWLVRGLPVAIGVGIIVWAVR